MGQAPNGSFNNGSAVGPFVFNVNNGNANANNGFRLANGEKAEGRRRKRPFPVPPHLGRLSLPDMGKEREKRRDARKCVSPREEETPIVTYDDSLFDEFLTFENFHEGYLEARKGKRFKPEIMRTARRIELVILEMLAEIRAGTWHPQKTYDFETRDTKRRTINAPTFRDRVFHHAFYRVYAPPIEKKFIADSYANIKGKGQHRAVRRLQHFLRGAAREKKPVYVLYCDIAHFYDSIDHEKLLQIFGNTFRGGESRALARALVAGYNDDTGKGLPKGAVTSGLLANLYLNELDHFVKEGLRERRYLRFVDDFVIVSTDKRRLRECKREIAWFLETKLALTLNRKSQIRGIGQGVDFLGYRVFLSRVLPRKRNVRRMRRRLRHLQRLFAAWRVGLEEIAPVLASFLGYLKHARARRTEREILKDFVLRRKDK